jgi:hypothetical protein
MDMTLGNFRFSFAFLVLVLTTGALSAQDIDLVGAASWRKVPLGLRISAERVENLRESGTSGNLRLQIWATYEIDDGTNDLTGYVLGTYNLGSLSAGYAFVNLSRVVRYYRPPPGLYYTTITVEENTLNGYYIMDSANFPGIVNLGRYGYGAVDDLGTNGDVGFVGDVSWLAGNGSVKIYTEQMLNQRATRSGTLRIRLWATSTPYAGEAILQGYPMATRGVGRLSSGGAISLFSRSTIFRAPPAGEYYVTMTLEEYVPGGWNIVDYVTFGGTSIF